MTALVSFAILLFGIVAFRALPVAALPSVDYPTIQVQRGLPGANPETMASSVATPLERELSTIAGIESISRAIRRESRKSRSSSDSIATSMRPRRTCNPPSQRPVDGCPRCLGRLRTRKQIQPSSRFCILRSIETLPMYTVNEYAETLMAQRMSMVSGVSRVQVFGAQKYAVRVQVDPDALAAHNIGIDEVQRAIQTSNTNLPTGRLRRRKQAFTIQSTGS